MNTGGAAILANLQAVARERAARAADPVLASKVIHLKEYQQRRFLHTYADFIASARYGGAARFFLNELYGPADFTDRDTQFERVVPSLALLFPHEIVETATALSALHALTESLDTVMASNACATEWTPAAYLRTWQATGRPADRDTQISLTVSLARRLDRMTRSVLLRTGLRLMRAPARASGLEQLQRFLEAGFDTFGALGGAEDFIREIEQRERAFVSRMFGADLRGAESDAGECAVLAGLPKARRASESPAGVR